VPSELPLVPLRMVIPGVHAAAAATGPHVAPTPLPLPLPLPPAGAQFEPLQQRLG
jgi:hypothetical protein